MWFSELFFTKLLMKKLLKNHRFLRKLRSFCSWISKLLKIWETSEKGSLRRFGLLGLLRYSNHFLYGVIGLLRHISSYIDCLNFFIHGWLYLHNILFIGIFSHHMDWSYSSKSNIIDRVLNKHDECFYFLSIELEIYNIVPYDTLTKQTLIIQD